MPFRRKSRSGPILGICEKFNVAPEQTVMIGDSVFDIRSGQGAGAVTVAALYGYGDRTAMEALAPTYSIQTPEELIRLSFK